MLQKPFIQNEGKLIEKDVRFNHVMALALDPRTQHQEGVIRCIVSREGDVSVAGYIDRSKLHKTKMTPLECFEVSELYIKNELEILDQLTEDGFECIGLEDPDIWVDEANDLLHLYFTIPMVNFEKGISKIYLGHAAGKDIDTLEMTWPVLAPDEIGGAKELSVAPLNSKGFRYNLVESSKDEDDFGYSVIRTVIAEDMSKDWKFGEIVFHPKKEGISWIAGHASPGPLFPEGFINVGLGKSVGVLNGREANRIVDGQVQYGMFSIGLFIYDYENGKIDWVSPEPLIRDTEAQTITFASQFVLKEKGEGILYAHVDDSFVRSYVLHADLIRAMLPSDPAK
jgi:hypothetical protein